MCKETDEQRNSDNEDEVRRKKRDNVNGKELNDTSLPSQLPKPGERPKPPPEKETIKLPDHKTDLDGDPLQISTKDHFVDLELSEMSGK